MQLCTKAQEIGRKKYFYSLTDCTQVCPRRQRRLGRGGETPSSSLVRRSSQWPASSLPNSLQVDDEFCTMEVNFDDGNGFWTMEMDFVPWKWILYDGNELFCGRQAFRVERCRWVLVVRALSTSPHKRFCRSQMQRPHQKC